MDRKEEFEKIKKLIKKHIKDAECGIYNTRNIVGDSMTTIYLGKYFTLDICYSWEYYEVFGTIENEFKELEKYYEKLKKGEK